jgi:hypothetical protein
MERNHEETKTQESPRGGPWQVRRAGAQRGQTAGQPRKRTHGRPSQKPQEETCGAAQRAASPAWSSEELINVVIASIHARFGEFAIGLGERGIRSFGGR